MRANPDNNTSEVFTGSDLDWYEEHLAGLQAHRGEWAAIPGQCVVAFAPDLLPLLDDVHRLGVDDP